jgi:hypothetical protein
MRGTDSFRCRFVPESDASCGGSVLSMRTSNDPSSFSAATTSTTTSGSTSATAHSQGHSWSTSHAQSTSPVTLTSVNTAQRERQRTSGPAWESATWSRASTSTHPARSLVSVPLPAAHGSSPSTLRRASQPLGRPRHQRGRSAGWRSDPRAPRLRRSSSLRGSPVDLGHAPVDGYHLKRAVAGFLTARTCQ